MWTTKTDHDREPVEHATEAEAYERVSVLARHVNPPRKVYVSFVDRHGRATCRVENLADGAAR